MREFDTIEAFSGNRELYKTDSDSLSEQIIASPKPIPKTPKMRKSYPYKIKRPLANSVKVDLRANPLGEKQRVISTYLEADIIVEEEEFDYSGTPRPNGENDNPLFDSNMYMTQNEPIIEEEEDEIPYLASGNEEILSLGSPRAKQGEIGRDATVDIKFEKFRDIGEDLYKSGVETDLYRTYQENKEDNLTDLSGKAQNNIFFAGKRDTTDIDKKSLIENNNLKDTADESNKTKETDFSNEVKIMLQRKLSLERGDKTLNFVLFSWQKDFYDHLRSGTGEQRKGQLFRVLGGNWRSKFDKKGVIFFYFVIEWISYVKSTLVVKNISWNKIPGYRVSHLLM